MMPNPNEQELRSLFSLWLNGDGDAHTIRRLSELAEVEELKGIWQNLLSSIPEDQHTTTSGMQHAAILDKVYQNLVELQPELAVTPAPIRRINTFIRYVAAAVLLLLAAGAWFFFNNTAKQQQKDQLVHTNPPASTSTLNTNKAILTLGSGKQLLLDSSGNGKLAQEAGSVVIKSAAGQLLYQPTDSLTKTNQATEFNTVATPRGGEYKITLPDGTMVWLNAASSITFPTAFRGTDRTVSVQGEAYLQVAKNAAQPFKVKVGDAVIDVLGTEFNLSAYNDEPVTKATLLEGSISVTKGNERRILKPGQQCWFRDKSNVLNVAANIDTDQVIAWKNGSFDFRNQELESVMKQIGRWYNMDIKYEGKKPEVRILGMMGRNTELSTLLKSMELTSGIKFTVEAGTASQPGKIIVQQ